MIDYNEIEKYKENDRIEAKNAVGGLPESIWETYSAFANTEGGVILLGVDEDTDKFLKVINLPDAELLALQFWSRVNDKNTVSCNIVSLQDIKIMEIDKKRILAIKVPKAEKEIKPVYINNNPLTGSYRRIGEADIRMTPEEAGSFLNGH